MAVNTELCSKDRAALPPSLWKGHSLSGWEGRMKLQESSQTKFLWTVAMLEVMMMAIYVLLVRSTTIPFKPCSDMTTLPTL